MRGGAVAITGLGAASALGTGIPAHRAALWAGRDGIRRIDRFDTESLSTHLGATWPVWQGRAQPDASAQQDLAATAAGFPLHELALAAAQEAWRSAGDIETSARAALVFGTCFGQGFREFGAVTERIARGLALDGPQITISTACSSSTNAIGLARDLLLHGHADVVIAGGADSLLREAFAGFSALGVLSAESVAPFSEPVGTTLGEGAAFVVLERASDAARRHAVPWGTICGYGLSADAYHETTPHPAGDGVARAIRGALQDAGWLPGDIDFVSAHATGTANNDRIEWSVIERELSAHGRPPHVSGSKGHVGHTQGASGALELVLALICHREGRVPPTLHFRGARSGCSSDPVAASLPRATAFSRGLKLSAAFGGANAAVAYACADVPSRKERTRASVVVAGAGVVGPRGASRLSEVLTLTEERNVGACREPDLDSLGVDGRRLDRSSRWLTGAAALALSEDRKRERLDRTGLFVAATRMPRESSVRCTESIRLRGIGGTSAAAFARMSVNAPAGACSVALGLLGPTSTLSIGRGSGLLAVVLAAEWLAWREDALSIVAGGVDEPAGVASDEAEGAACILLKRSTIVEKNAVLIAASAIAGPGRGLEVVERVMQNRPLVDGLIIDADETVTNAFQCAVATDRGVGMIDGRALWGTADATRSSVMALVAAAHVAEGHADSILVVAAAGASSVAALFQRGNES